MKLDEMKITEMYDLNNTIAARLFEGKTYPWEVLDHIGSFIETLGAQLPQEDYQKVGRNIWIHKRARVAPSVAMGGPAIICEGADIRHGAFIRGRVIVGHRTVVGNSCEIKNSILFDGVQVPHYNYVGDSVLGAKAHMGAGAVTSNVKNDKSPVSVHAEDGDLETGLKKFGAMLGDGAEIGCNSVLNPGAVIGKNSSVYPLSSVRGCVSADSIYKGKGDIVKKEARDLMEAAAEAPAEAPAAKEPAEKPAAQKAPAREKAPAKKSKNLKVVK